MDQSTSRVARIEASFSSHYHCWLFYESHELDGDLLHTLTKLLPHINPTELPDRIIWGGVFVNGIEVNENISLPIPCKLEYYEPRFDIAQANDYFPAFNPSLILYEDQYLIAFCKPARLPCQPGKEQKYFNVRRYIESYSQQKVHMPSRLDMSTYGVVLMSKHMETHKSLQRLYEYNQIRKSYHLIVSGHLPWQEYCHTGSIGKDPIHAVLRKVVCEGGKVAQTDFKKLFEFNDPDSGLPLTLLEARPKTGRTHQIRVHISDLGYPIIGDNFYQGLPAPALRLMAYSLDFRHPIGGLSHHIKIPFNQLPTWAPLEYYSSFQ